MEKTERNKGKGISRRALMGQAVSGQAAPGLYDPRFEHDSCGIGAVANIKGVKSHKTVEQALHIVENLEHRAGKDAEGKTGDGVGIMLQVSHRFFKKVAAPLGIRLGGEREYGVGMFFFPQDELRRKSDKNGVVGSGKGKKQPQIYMTQTEKIGFFVGTDDAAGGGVLL